MVCDCSNPQPLRGSWYIRPLEFAPVEAAAAEDDVADAQLMTYVVAEASEPAIDPTRLLIESALGRKMETVVEEDWAATRAVRERA